MMKMSPSRNLSAIQIFSISLLAFSFGQSHALTFDFVDAEANTVIFEGDDVRMRCEGTPGRMAFMEIILGNSVKGRSEADSYVLEYSISNVKESDSGYYTCSATYEPVDGNKVTKSVNLHLEAFTTATRPHCRFNGTGENIVGDTLLFSCFCLIEDQCSWRRRGSAGNMTDQERELHGTKSITRLFLGPLTINDDNTVLECSYGESENCAIGPFSVSGRPLTPPANGRSSEEEKREGKAPLIVGISLFLLFLCSCGFLLALFLRRRRERRRMTRHQPIKDIDDKDEDEHAYATVDFSRKNRSSVASHTRQESSRPSIERSIYIQRKGSLRHENPYLVPNAHFEAQKDPSPDDFRKKRRLPSLPRMKKPSRDDLK